MVVSEWESISLSVLGGQETTYIKTTVYFNQVRDEHVVHNPTQPKERKET